MISLLKSRISLNSWTSVPIYGIKRGYQEQRILNFFWHQWTILEIVDRKLTQKSTFLVNSSIVISFHQFEGEKSNFLDSLKVPYEFLYMYTNCFWT